MINNQIDEEKQQLLRVIRKLPHTSRVEWNNTLGCVNSKNKVDPSKIRERLKQLESDGLVIQIENRYVLNTTQTVKEN